MASVVTDAKFTAAPCDSMPSPVSTVLALETNWNGVAFGPSAPKCTSASSVPPAAPEVVADAGSLPLVRPPSLTVASKPGTSTARIGVSSVSVTVKEPVAVLPSKSLAVKSNTRFRLSSPASG